MATPREARQAQIADLEGQLTDLAAAREKSSSSGFGGRIGRMRDFVYQGKANDINNQLGALTMSPEWAAANPDKAQAELTRRQWEAYEARGMKLEDSVLDEVMDPASAERAATSAGNLARRAFGGAGDMTARRLERHGVQATAEQQAANARRADLSQAMAVGGAKQTARESTREGDIDLLSGTLNVGAGLSSAATQGLESAASMKHTRDETHKAQKAAHTQGLISTGLTLGALAFSI